MYMCWPLYTSTREYNGTITYICLYLVCLYHTHPLYICLEYHDPALPSYHMIIIISHTHRDLHHITYPPWLTYHIPTVTYIISHTHRDLHHVTYPPWLTYHIPTVTYISHTHRDLHHITYPPWLTYHIPTVTYISHTHRDLHITYPPWLTSYHIPTVTYIILHISHTHRDLHHITYPPWLTSYHIPTVTYIISHTHRDLHHITYPPFELTHIWLIPTVTYNGISHTHRDLHHILCLNWLSLTDLSRNTMVWCDLIQNWVDKEPDHANYEVGLKEKPEDTTWLHPSINVTWLYP